MIEGLIVFYLIVATVLAVSLAWGECDFGEIVKVTVLSALAGLLWPLLVIAALWTAFDDWCAARRWKRGDL